MDLLASLNVDALPEQQTRLLHLIRDCPDFQQNLGYDACCSCGSSLIEAVRCRSCRRVKYCSETCRQQDSSPPGSTSNKTLPNEGDNLDYDQEEEEETALGHSAVVCALLNLCNDDEAVESGETLDDSARMEAARDRIKSEYESYPATLANVLAEGPCYQETIQKCAAAKSNNKTLVIHVIGASQEAELSRGPATVLDKDDDDDRSVVQDYAEALAELAETNRLAKIELVFIGPECPTTPWNDSVPLKGLDEKPVAGTLTVRTIKSIYNKQALLQQQDGDASSSSKPDIVVLFNPGFTVPDYQHWNETLKTIPSNIPFLSTTNTEMEGMADAQYLLDQDKIQTLPPGLADIFGVYSSSDEDDSYSNSFFDVNPFAGNRVRQNSTMANDLFVKNRWILGGVIGSFDPSVGKKEKHANERSKKAKTSTRMADGPLSFANNKAGNPALI